MTHSDQGNAAQQARLANLNDTYGIARWELRRGELCVWTDDDEGAAVPSAAIHDDGTITWADA